MPHPVSKSVLRHVPGLSCRLFQRLNQRVQVLAHDGKVVLPAAIWLVGEAFYRVRTSVTAPVAAAMVSATLGLTNSSKKMVLT